MTNLQGLNAQQAEEVVKALTGKTPSEIGIMIAEVLKLGRELSQTNSLLNETQRERDEWIKIKGPALKDQRDKALKQLSKALQILKENGVEIESLYTSQS